MGLSSIFLTLFFISTSLLAVDLDCSFQQMAKVRRAIQKELDGKKSISFDTYGAVENVMLCDFFLFASPLIVPGKNHFLQEPLYVSNSNN